MDEKIRQYVLDLGADDVGFAAAQNYQNPKSYEITKFLPKAKTIVVLVFRVLSSCESPSLPVAFNGYAQLGTFAKSVAYQTARFLENKFGAKTANIPVAIPYEIHNDRRGIADFSHRHAAVAAGLGVFGRHNLLIHPQFGTRVNLCSIITNIDIKPSPKCGGDLCSGCNICVENCPGGALDEAGKTDLMKCLKHSLPYALPTDIGFWTQIFSSQPEEQKNFL